MASKLERFVDQLTIKRIALVFFLLVLPIVFAPYHADDFFHLLILSQDPMLERGGDGSVLGLFSFVDDNVEHRQQLLRYGVLPWWVSDEYHFRFWRPLGEITHWLDYVVFGVNPLPAHLHSILWFVLACIPFYCLVKKTLPDNRTLLLLCMALFMWDGQHIGTISWIANRSALIALTFALWALYCHMRWRDGEGGGWAVFSHLLLVLSLLGGEIALSIVGYFFAYALFLDKDVIKVRVLTLFGYAAIALMYLWLHRYLDYGASTSDFYINIFTDPAEFFEVVVDRFFVYMASVFLPIPAGISWAGGDQFWYLAIVISVTGFLLLCLLLFSFKDILKANNYLAFWFFGALLSTLPVTSAAPQDRLTLFVTVGIDIFLAGLIYFSLINKQSLADLFKEKWIVNIAKYFVVFHLVLSPLHLLGGTSIMHKESRSLLNHALELDNEVSIEDKKMVVLEMPLGISISMMGMRKAMGEKLPESAFFIGNEEGETFYELVSDTEMIVARDIGFVIGYEEVFRSIEKEPYKIGDIIEMHNVRIQILSIDENSRPMKIKLTFDEGLDSGNWLFYHFGKKEWVRSAELPGL